MLVRLIWPDHHCHGGNGPWGGLRWKIVVAIPPTLMNEKSLWCAGQIWQICIPSSMMLGFLCSSMQTPEPHSVQKDTTRPEDAKCFQTKLNFSTEHIAEQIDSTNVPSYHTSPAPAQTSSQVFFLCHQPMVSAIDHPTRSLLSIKMVSGTWATTDRLSTQIPKPTRSHRRHQFSKWLLRATSQAPG